MLFAVICMDKPGKSDLRAATRPAHLEYLERFRSRNAISGPLLTDDGTAPKGSLLILDFADRKEAQAFADNDPYAKAGLFDSVTITPFKKVFGPA
ncbi:MAG TPA: YciI family protein [Alphaproteobacteria bacterium]|nr:YciI family protein [Alphaproteobacteria bacterium]